MKGLTVRTLPWLALLTLACCGAAAEPPPSEPSRNAPLVQNGWLVHNGRVIWRWIQHNGWWGAGGRPNLTRRSVGDPLGDLRPNRTEHLDALTDNMLRYGYPGFEHNYGLWYERRRDAHDTVRREDAAMEPPFLEQPWARSGTGTAWDGLPKYDLSQFNDWYFERLRQFGALCDKKGTVLFHKYYMQHALLETQAHYVDFPWRAVNCLQQTGMPDGIPAANAFYDVSNPVRRELRRAYIRKCLDTLGHYSNVVHLVGQEYTGPLPFVQFWIDTIVDWESETGKRVHIGLGAPKDVQDAILGDPVRAAAIDVLDLRYWWIRADGSVVGPKGGEEAPGRRMERGTIQGQETTPEKIYQKVREYRDRYPDKAIIDAIEADRQQHWAFFMAGGSLLVGGTITCPGGGDPPTYVAPERVDIILPSYEFVRDQLATRVPRMRPADIVSSDQGAAWCLAEAGRTYLVYTLRGGEVHLDLRDARGEYAVSLLDPRTGTLVTRPSVSGGARASLSTPEGEDWIAWLHRRE